jgi:phosphopantothenoylcysteine decarboxylase/phosphopantothenate--cysteine ligase
MLEGKKILLGISGSIAAYKCAALTRLFVKAGAQVQIIITEAACDFVSPLTLATLSKNPVHSKFIKNEQGEWTNHVELGLWADIFIIAPCSANTLAKMANGICDNLLMATYLSAKCPVYFAPAMDLDMYLHQSTQANIQKLIGYGNTFIQPNSGELASGLNGPGRMAEPEEIFELTRKHFKQDLALKNKRIIITAGPTYEAIDPVRFIGNHSSGKMGFALAESFAKAGADVLLISGPTNLKTTHAAIRRIDITSAAEMYANVISNFDNCDVVVMSAAVADYTPIEKSTEKIKKQADSFQISLTKTTDILAELGKRKNKQILIGFALETNNEEAHAIDKLKRKNLDLIVLNSLNDEGAGFAGDQNKITTYNKLGIKTTYDLKPKMAVADDLLQELIKLLNA